jgi:hypothetical protein
MIFFGRRPGEPIAYRVRLRMHRPVYRYLLNLNTTLAEYPTSF